MKYGPVLKKYGDIVNKSGERTPSKTAKILLSRIEEEIKQ